jgi:hypothetical protein
MSVKTAPVLKMLTALIAWDLLCALAEKRLLQQMDSVWKVSDWVHHDLVWVFVKFTKTQIKSCNKTHTYGVGIDVAVRVCFSYRAMCSSTCA